MCSLQCQSNSGHSASSLQNVGADLQRPFLPAKHNSAEATQNGNDDQHPHKQKATSCSATLQTGLRHSSPILDEAPTHARLAKLRKESAAETDPAPSTNHSTMLRSQSSRSQIAILNSDCSSLVFPNHFSDQRISNAQIRPMNSMAHAFQSAQSLFVS